MDYRDTILRREAFNLQPLDAIVVQVEAALTSLAARSAQPKAQMSGE